MPCSRNGANDVGVPGSTRGRTAERPARTLRPLRRGCHREVGRRPEGEPVTTQRTRLHAAETANGPERHARAAPRMGRVGIEPSDLGIISPPSQAAANRNRLNLPAIRRFQRCTKLQQTATNGDRPVRSPYAHHGLALFGCVEEMRARIASHPSFAKVFPRVNEPLPTSPPAPASRATPPPPRGASRTTRRHGPRCRGAARPSARCAGGARCRRGG